MKVMSDGGPINMKLASNRALAVPLRCQLFDFLK
jgi:hypothetical protein